MNGLDDNELLFQLEYLSGQAPDPTLSAFKSFFKKVTPGAHLGLGNQPERDSQRSHGSSSGDDGLVKKDLRYGRNKSKPSTEDATNQIGQRSEPEDARETLNPQEQNQKQIFAEIFRSLQENVEEDQDREVIQETERNLVQREQQFYQERPRPSFNQHILGKFASALFGQESQQLSGALSGASRYQKRQQEAEVEMEPIDLQNEENLNESFGPRHPSEVILRGEEIPALLTDRTVHKPDLQQQHESPDPRRVEDPPYDRLKGKGPRVNIGATKQKFGDGSPS